MTVLETFYSVNYELVCLMTIPDDGNVLYMYNQKPFCSYT